MTVPNVPVVMRAPLPELASSAQPVSSASPRTVLVVEDYWRTRVVPSMAEIP